MREQRFTLRYPDKGEPENRRTGETANGLMIASLALGFIDGLIDEKIISIGETEKSKDETVKRRKVKTIRKRRSIL